MKFEPGDYGIIKVIDGLHKGRIGYYDDDDIILPEDETFDDDESIYNESKKSRESQLFISVHSS